MAYDPEIVAKLSEGIASKIKSPRGYVPQLTPGEQARGLSGIGFAVNDTAENKLRQLKMEEDEYNDWFIKETEKRSKEQGITLSTDPKVMEHARLVYKTLLEQDAILNGYSIEFIMELRREHSAFRYSHGRYGDLRQQEGTVPPSSERELQDRDAGSSG